MPSSEVTYFERSAASPNAPALLSGERSVCKLPLPTRVAFIGNYLPRECGIATFTTDLCTALAAEYGEGRLFAIPVNDLDSSYNYPEQVRLEIAQEDLSSYERAADFLNTADAREIADVLVRYGEERQARRIAKAILCVACSTLRKLAKNSVGRRSTTLKPESRQQSNFSAPLSNGKRNKRINQATRGKCIPEYQRRCSPVVHCARSMRARFTNRDSKPPKYTGCLRTSICSTKSG